MDAGFAEPVVPTMGALGAVNLMTVHQSKGLQFSVVILADLRATGRNDTGPVRYARGRGLLVKPKVARRRVRNRRVGGGVGGRQGGGRRRAQTLALCGCYPG